VELPLLPDHGIALFPVLFSELLFVS
jgi:hypothetical protein